MLNCNVLAIELMFNYFIFNTAPLFKILTKIKWPWIGHVHVCRMQPTSIPRVPMRGTPTGERKNEKSQKEKISCEKKWKRTSALGVSSGDGHRSDQHENF